MLINEEKKNNFNLSLNNLIALKACNNSPEIETFSPSIAPDTTNNQISLLNNNSPEKDISSPYIKSQKKFQFKYINNNNDSSHIKRMDRNGNEICKNGKQKVTFIDKITKNKFADIINIESYKKYNKVEEVNFANHNGCCLIE